jgi:hypothetical protein
MPAADLPGCSSSSPVKSADKLSCGINLIEALIYVSMGVRYISGAQDGRCSQFWRQCTTVAVSTHSVSLGTCHGLKLEGVIY